MIRLIAELRRRIPWLILTPAFDRPAVLGGPDLDAASKVDAGSVPETPCLNCYATVRSAYCGRCGQAAHVHRTVAAFFHDLIHGVFHFEGKLWHTLPLLAWRPGQLTREYVDGRRARYISPIGLFLLTLFLSFALLGAVGGTHSDTGVHHDFRRSLGDAKSEIAGRITALEHKRSETPPLSRTGAALDKHIADLRADQMLLNKVSVPQDADAIRGKSLVGTAMANALEATWRGARENPALFLYELQSRAYKYGWILIPISVPFLWLLFPLSRRFRLYDHMVFVTYSISFMLILAALFSVTVYFDVAALGLLPLLYAPVHMYRQLQGAYGLSGFGAAMRAAAMFFFAVIALALFAITLLAMAPT